MDTTHVRNGVNCKPCMSGQNSETIPPPPPPTTHSQEHKDLKNVIYSSLDSAKVVFKSLQSDNSSLSVSLGLLCHQIAFSTSLDVVSISCIGWCFLFR